MRDLDICWDICWEYIMENYDEFLGELNSKVLIEELEDRGYIVKENKKKYIVNEIYPYRVSFLSEEKKLKVKVREFKDYFHARKYIYQQINILKHVSKTKKKFVLLKKKNNKRKILDIYIFEKR